MRISGCALRDAVGRALRLEGYEVVLATDGPEALGAMARERADLVVLDVSMPTMSGVEVCRRLRDAGDPAAVLMLTARDGVPERVAGLDAGADDYLVKPFALEELLAAACQFVTQTGKLAAIGALADAAEILAGNAGTHIVPECRVARAEHAERGG